MGNAENYNIGIICNTSNVDMAQYFLAKVDAAKGDKSIAFAAHEDVARQRSNVYISSRAKSSRSVAGALIDLADSFNLARRFKLLGIKVCLFDTAHVSNVLQALILKLFRIETIFSIHDYSPHPGSVSGRVKLYNYVVKNIFRDRRIFFSRGEFVRSSDFVCDVSGLQKKAKGIDTGYFLFFGRIEPYKGLDYLVEIAKIESNKYFVVAGRGDDRALEKLRRLKNVKLINKFIHADDLTSLISNSTAVLLPYTSATQSGVIVEAYSYAKPVVVFDVGNLSQYVSDKKTGRVIPLGDIVAFCGALSDISDSYEEYSNEAAAIFSRRFGLEAASAQFERLVTWCRNGAGE